MANHPLLDQLDTALRDRVPGDPVDFVGEWSKPSRRTYKSEAQLSKGSGPFADVVDLQWHGTLTGAGPIGGIAFLLTAGNLYWAKAPEISLTLSVDVSLHAYAEYTTDRATFTARMAGAYLPGIPVSVSSDLAAACTIGPCVVKTGRVSCLAQANSAAFFVLLFQRAFLKIGRKRLWRVKDEIASSLTSGMRELLTHRRTGSVQSQQTKR
ncbi:MAG: hypothetical protein ACRD2N_08710 [Vicinamibacterales bacterium]